MKKRGVMDWYQIKKYLYYTHDDFVRDIIALHLKKGAVTDIYNYICKTSLFSMEDRFKGLVESIEDNICNYCCPIKPLYTRISSLNPAEIGMISSNFKFQAPH